VGAVRKPSKPGTIARARQLRRDRTDVEGLLWWKLRGLKPLGYHFRRQVPMRGYFLDFAEHGSRVAVELDGSQHGTRENRERDAVRDRVLASEGYRVLRFWNDDVWRDLDGTVETIIREAQQGQPPPEMLRISTSPLGGGD
jgi:very-short-patch-repair endonuclease